MYTLPEDFSKTLYDTFHGKYRIRWSDKRSEFQLEQKVATGQVLDPPSINPDAITPYYDTYDDNWIRARDGYFYVMSLRNGDRMPCPVCGLTVKVPIMETRESVCESCRNHGRDGRYVAAFYPFNHVLIEHLLDIDPENGGPQRVRARIRAKQIDRKSREFKTELDRSDYAVLENKTQIEQNPMSGYGPKGRQATAQDIRL